MACRRPQPLAWLSRQWRCLCRRARRGLAPAGQPRLRRLGPAPDLEALAQQLQRHERQLRLARRQHAHQHLSAHQLEGLSRHTAEDVQRLLAALDGCAHPLLPPWALERLQAAVRHWRERSPPPGDDSLLADVSDLQAQLLEMANTLYVCSRVQDRDGAW